MNCQEANANFPPIYDTYLESSPIVWILGNQYNSLEDEALEDIRSRIWITYRKGFPRIGGSGPTSDYGWGCMLRCGQMVVAQALINKHFGREWRWKSKKEMIKRNEYRTYLKILSLFLDQKGAPYSIHQIAQMGASEGKPVGNWFGPNTVAQTLKKLAEYDNWNHLAIHVALDNLVIIDDIKACKFSHPQKNISEQFHTGTENSACSSVEKKWTDLLLFIPLRLGLSELNLLYHEPLKKTFHIKQSLGIIGGRPNHALYFVGYVGEELIYLDPHTTQPTIDLDLESLLKNPQVDLADIDFDDSSYHVENSQRMPFNHLDPSIALCFHFPTEEDFDSWCSEARDLLIKDCQPLFELFKERPFHMKSISTAVDSRQAPTEYDIGNCTPEHLIPNFCEVEKSVLSTSSDDEFEILTTDC